MSNKTYDTLKVIALIILPLAAFISKFAHIWGLPYGDEISQTLIAFDAMLGAYLKVASDKYAEEQNETMD